MTDQRALVKLADDLPSDVRRWVLRGGAVPDAVWFGDYCYLKQRTGACTWRRSDVCERLRAALSDPRALEEQKP